MWYRDLDPLDHYGKEHAAYLRAIGWLQRGKAYTKGDVEVVVFERLKTLAEHPTGPFVSAGLHGCDLCRFAPEAHGSFDVFVPGTGILYVCPQLILHYINVHDYRPPEEFCQAVVTCPAPRTTEYRKAFLANGGRRFVKAMKRLEVPDVPAPPASRSL